MSPQTVVRIQTAVVSMVAALLTWAGHLLATHNVNVDLTPLSGILVLAVMGVVAYVYRLVIAPLQKKFPILGWLKGHPGVVTQVLDPTNKAALASPPGPHQVPPSA